MAARFRAIVGSGIGYALDSMAEESAGRGPTATSAFCGVELFQARELQGRIPMVTVRAY
jgi:hypothetical protein